MSKRKLDDEEEDVKSKRKEWRVSRNHRGLIILKIEESADRMSRSGISVEINSSMGWVTISSETEDSIFLQGDEGYEFIRHANALWESMGTIDMQTALLHLSEPYVECIWS